MEERYIIASVRTSPSGRFFSRVYSVVSRQFSCNKVDIFGREYFEVLFYYNLASLDILNKQNFFGIDEFTLTLPESF